MADPEPDVKGVLTTSWLSASGYVWVIYLIDCSLFIAIAAHVSLFVTIRFSDKGSLYKKVSYRLLIYQLLTDFIWCAWLLGRSIFAASNEWDEPWEDHSLPCTFEGVLLFSCVQSSLYNSAIIAYDRYRMIVTPLAPLPMSRAMQLYVASLVLTVVQSFIVDIIGSYTFTSGEMFCLVDFWSIASNMWVFFTVLTPVFAFTGYNYFLIYRSLMTVAANKSKPTLKLAHTGVHRSTRHVNNTRKEEQLAMKMFVLFIYWIVCWLPGVAMFVFKSFVLVKDTDQDIGRIWALVSALGCVINAASNPFLCFGMMVSVRHAFKGMVGWKHYEKKPEKMRIVVEKHLSDTFNPMQEEKKKEKEEGKIEKPQKPHLLRAMTFKAIPSKKKKRVEKQKELEESEIAWKSRRKIKREETFAEKQGGEEEGAEAAPTTLANYAPDETNADASL